MFYRKMTEVIEEQLKTPSAKILVVEGLPATGKTTMIRAVAKKLFRQYVEVDLEKDKNGEKHFTGMRDRKRFFHAIESIIPETFSAEEKTLVFLDEIQVYPKLIPFLKYVAGDERYTFVVSGTGLEKLFVPIQDKVHFEYLRAMDFEEYLYASGIDKETFEDLHERYNAGLPVDSALHERLMQLWNDYLIVGGMPEVVSVFLKTRDLQPVRKLQHKLRELYARDMKTYGIEVPSVSELSLPLTADNDEDSHLYFHDVGMFTSVYEFTDDNPVVTDSTSYQTYVADEAAAHGISLYCYKGSDIFLCENNNAIIAISTERDIPQIKEQVETVIVPSKDRVKITEGNVTYIPVYDLMFFFAQIAEK